MAPRQYYSKLTDICRYLRFTIRTHMLRPHFPSDSRLLINDSDKSRECQSDTILIPRRKSREETIARWSRWSSRQPQPRNGWRECGVTRWLCRMRRFERKEIIAAYRSRDCGRDVRRGREARISARRRCRGTEQPVRSIWRRRRCRRGPVRVGPLVVRNYPCNSGTRCSCTVPARFGCDYVTLDFRNRNYDRDAQRYRDC